MSTLRRLGQADLWGSQSPGSLAYLVNPKAMRMPMLKVGGVPKDYAQCCLLAYMYTRTHIYVPAPKHTHIYNNRLENDIGNMADGNILDLNGLDRNTDGQPEQTPMPPRV